MDKKLMLGKWHRHAVWQGVVVPSFWTNLPKSRIPARACQWHEVVVQISRLKILTVFGFFVGLGVMFGLRIEDFVLNPN